MERFVDHSYRFVNRTLDYLPRFKKSSREKPKHLLIL